MSAYFTFLRSARSFEEFATAEKTVVDEGLTEKEARDACAAYNASRSPAEEAAGTKMEFTTED